MTVRASRKAARAFAVLCVGFGMAALAVAWAQDRTVTITRTDCAALVEHAPEPGVVYTPGRDVRGRPVAPADLDGGPEIALPEYVNIPITVDLAARFGIPATSDLFEAEAYVGTARVRLKDGRAWFNGKPLTSEEQHALARLCQEVGATAAPE